MKIANLPPLPQAPNGGKTAFTATVKYTGPDTVDTRLGSIPADYSTGTGYTKTETILFKDGVKEAANPRGRSDEIWRPQPQLDADGTPRMKPIEETLTATPRSKLLNTLGFGAAFGAAGGFIGVVGAILTGEGAVIPAVAGTAAVLGGALGFARAAGDRVKLEYQETPILDYNLVGYQHRSTEDETKDSDGNVTSSEYDHTFRPVFDNKQLGTYYKPVVVHYRD